MTTTEAAQAAPPKFTAKQKMVLLVLLGAGFMLSVDFSILNVALPQMGSGVGLRVDQFAWITSAFTLPAAGFTLLLGRLADFFGRRKLFMAGLVLLTLASLVGGFASSATMLLTARALQGFATALTMPAAMSLLTTTFAEGAVRDRVLGMNGALQSGGFTVGAFAGGILVGLLSWRAAFFINVPVAIALLVATPALIAESTRPEKAKLDVPGAITVTGGLLAVVYAVMEKSLVFAAIGVALLVAFYVIERRAAAPLASMRVLARPTVKWGNFAGLVVFSMETGMIFLTTLYLQDVLRLSPLVTGLVFGVPGLAAVAAGIIAGRLIGRVGSRKLLTAGLAVQGLATIPLIFTSPSVVLGLVIVASALFVGFFGHVSSIVSYAVTGTSGLPDEEQGLATGMTSMTQQVSLTIGIPILSSIAATQAAQLSGIHLALVVNVIITLTAAALVWFGLRSVGARLKAETTDDDVEVPEAGQRAA